MGVIDSITDVFSKMGAWLIDFINQVIALFWTPASGEQAGSLTFLGVLAVIALAISVFFLIVGLIQNFLHFRS